MAKDRSQVIFVCCGPPCSGKSAVAERLSEVLAANAAPVHYLTVDKLLTELIPDSDRNVNDRTFALDQMHDRAMQLATASTTVVLDSTYTRRQARTQLYESCGVLPMMIVELFVPPEVAVRRFEARGSHDAADLTAQSVRDAAAEFPWSKLPSILKYDTEVTAIDEIASDLASLASTKNRLFEDPLAWVAEGL